MVEDDEETDRWRIIWLSCFNNMVEDDEETDRWRIFCVILFYQNGRRRWRDSRVEFPCQHKLEKITSSLWQHLWEIRSWGLLIDCNFRSVVVGLVRVHVRVHTVLSCSDSIYYNGTFSISWATRDDLSVNFQVMTLLRNNRQAPIRWRSVRDRFREEARSREWAVVQLVTINLCSSFDNR